MRIPVVVLGALTLASACSTSTPMHSLPGPTATITELAAAFSACDIRRTMSLYAPEVEFAAPDLAQPIQGRASLERHLQGACNGAFTPVMTIVEQRATDLAPDAVLVTGTYTIGRSDRPHEKAWASYFVATLQNRAGHWLVRSQASLPLPPSR